MCRGLRARIKYWAVQESSGRAFLSVASMQLGVRRWEYPPARSLLQCRSSSWSCCTAKGRAERANAAE